MRYRCRVCSKFWRCEHTLNVTPACGVINRGLCAGGSAAKAHAPVPAPAHGALAAAGLPQAPYPQLAMPGAVYNTHALILPHLRPIERCAGALHSTSLPRRHVGH